MKNKLSQTFSRRTFIGLFFAGSIAATGFFWLRPFNFFRNLFASDLFKQIEIICDLIIPASENSPGAVDLDIPKKILDKAKKKPVVLQNLHKQINELNQEKFFEMPRADQEDFLSNFIFNLDRIGLYSLYGLCIALYYTNSNSWTSLAYKKPQPYGYPDYAECQES